MSNKYIAGKLIQYYRERTNKKRKDVLSYHKEIDLYVGRKKKSVCTYDTLKKIEEGIIFMNDYIYHNLAVNFNKQ